MHPTKQLLLERNGFKCMLCGQTFSYRELNWHHIKPKAVCKYYGEPIDDSYENGSILCLNCHAFVHTLYYWSEDYQHYMSVIRKNKK